MSGTTESLSGSDEVTARSSILDAHLKEMPSDEWLNKAHSSFTKLEQFIRPRTLTSRATPREELDENVKKIRAVREGSLPDICILPSGNHALRFTATNEPFECIAFGTMGGKLFIELFWEAVSKAQDAGENIVVHEIQSLVPRVLLSLDGYEFEMKYVQAETLIRRYPDIFSAPEEFLDDRKNCSQSVQNIVNDIHRRQTWFAWSSEEHRRAYHYIRAWAIHKGLFNTRPGITTQDFLTIGPGPGADRQEYLQYDSNKLIAQFFRAIGSAPELAALSAPSEDMWEMVLLKAEEEPFHTKLDFPYYVRISLMYTGSSKVKGAEWLSMVDRKIVKLKERLEARLTKPEIRIWPQRLISSNTDASDDIYEGYVVVGLRCPGSDISLAREISERWKDQVEEDTMLKNECFIDVTIVQGSSVIQDDDLRPDTLVWPKPIVKPEENHSKQENELEESENAKKGTPTKLPVRLNDSGAKGAKLRQASDILNRLRYDREYNIDECIVGYKDRHTSKIKEKPAADWASETTDEEFIPEHRIEYFKRDGEIIWDKSSRIDKVFNSG